MMVRFIAKIRNVNYEGCAFREFGFQTDDETKLNKLRKSRFYDNGFIEIDKKSDINIRVDRPENEMPLEELKALIKKREEAETVEFEVIEEAKVLYEELDYNTLKEEAKKQGMKWKGFPKKVDLIEYLNGKNT